MKVKNTTSRNLLNVVSAFGVLDGTFILQQIETIIEHPKTETERTLETAFV